MTGPRKQATVTVPTPYARIGSHPESEVVLPDASVAPRGLYLHATDDGVIGVGLCHDASAGAPFRGWLLPEQKVLAGTLPDIGAAVGRLPAADKRAAGRAVPCRPVSGADFLAAGSRDHSAPLAAPLTIVGRGRLCTMRLPYSRVSTAHCIVYRSENAVWVIDLLSANGTILEGSPVEAAEWPVGGPLMLGDIVITYAPSSTNEEAKQRPSEADSPQLREATDAQWEELSCQKEAWHAERLTRENELASRARQIEEQAAHIAAEREALARQRVALENGKWAEDRSPRRGRPNRPSQRARMPRRPSLNRRCLRSLPSSTRPRCRAPAATNPKPSRLRLPPSDEAAREHREAEEPDHAQDLAGRLTDRLIELHHSDLVRRRWRIVIVAMSLLAFLGILAAVAVFVARQG